MDAQYNYDLDQISDRGALMGDLRSAMTTLNNPASLDPIHDFRYIKIPRYRWVKSQLIEIGIFWTMVDGLREYGKVFFANSCYHNAILVRVKESGQPGVLWHLLDQNQANLRDGEFYRRFEPYPRYADPDDARRFAADYLLRAIADVEEVYGEKQLGALVRPFDKGGILSRLPDGRIRYIWDETTWPGVSRNGRFHRATDRQHAIDNREWDDDTMTAKIATRPVPPEANPRHTEWYVACSEAQRKAGIQDRDLVVDEDEED